MNYIASYHIGLVHCLVLGRLFSRTRRQSTAMGHLQANTVRWRMLTNLKFQSQFSIQVTGLHHSRKQIRGLPHSLYFARVPDMTNNPAEHLALWTWENTQPMILAVKLSPVHDGSTSTITRSPGLHNNLCTAEWVSTPVWNWPAYNVLISPSLHSVAFLSLYATHA